jgi:HAD superfamily hydrolase (TIGR01509 family)
MALDAVIFDVDGTLVDTNTLHTRAWQKAFAARGFTIPFDRIAPEIGKGGDQLVPSILGPETAKLHREALSELYGPEFLRLTETEGVNVFPGAKELIQAVRERGLKTAIATSAKKEYIEAIEKASGFDISHACDEFVTSDDAEKSKPEPDLILAASQKLRLSPAQCALVGDTPHDAESGRRGGVVNLMVKSGGWTEAPLREAGARSVWDDVAHLLQNLDEALALASPGSLHLSPDALENLMREALKTAREGMDAGEVPIGCILADGSGHIFARGYNRMNGTQRKTAHAEIIAFEAAGGKLPLDARDLILVSTLEPCVMCTGAAMEAAVDTIIYAMRAPADSGSGRVSAPQSPESQMPRIVGDVLSKESRELFEEWLRANKDTAQAKFVSQLLELTN